MCDVHQKAGDETGEGASGAYSTQQMENILKWQKQEAMLVVTAGLKPYY